jgi:hypothetical protein
MRIFVRRLHGHRNQFEEPDLATALGKIIARRELARIDSRSPVLVEIGVPHQRAEGEWACPYRIRGLGLRGIRHAYGVDPIQALQIVQQAIWRDLKPHERELSWFGQRGSGFYRYFPPYFSRTLMKRVERAIDREFAYEARRLKQLLAKRRQRAKHRRSSG